MHDAPIIEIGSLDINLSTILMLLITSVIVFVLCMLATRNLSVENPSKLQNFMEWVVDFVHNLIGSALPLHKVKNYLGLGMTLILFIFIANILGLPLAIISGHTGPVEIFGYVLKGSELATVDNQAHFLWFKSPTADINVTIGLALVVFLIIHFLGLKENRKHYLQHYLQPYWFFLPLNIIENLAKPIALAIRLFANIFAGEVLISTILKISWFGIPVLAAWQGFSIFIGALQAFIFTILTMVYIGQATIHEEH
ncbi:F0F1 ATP synthase subunit A [Paenibacillus yanchengensis]|uniref:ATP synthase subunit a n=1 Tax=Paenibacillus yanchengensis TaxID=2035833 RepID=A0ABW4YNA8_9BACL